MKQLCIIAIFSFGLQLKMFASEFCQSGKLHYDPCYGLNSSKSFLAEYQEEERRLTECQKEEKGIEGLRSEHDFSLLILDLIEIPVGWLTQDQLHMLRAAYDNEPQASCFKALDVSIMDLLQMHPSLLTFTELIVFEQITQESVVITEQEAVLVVTKR
ncbi:MAG: hypothetical protein NTZ68_01030 [Candidatus Dependentiae bacterium]|nr:hypothetical protein [Candidatus Dependentiae bacterium]